MRSLVQAVPRRRLVVLPVVLAAAALVAVPAGSGAVAARGLGPGLAPPWSNLLLNPAAETGDASAYGWDAVTIPGWKVRTGLPTVVRYGTPGFPTALPAGPWARGGRLFVGGAGGTAVLSEVVHLHAPGGTPPPAGTAATLSAWLGAGSASYSDAEALFVSGSGQTLGSISLPEVVAADGEVAGLRRERLSAALPAGTAAVQVLVTLGTTWTDFGGQQSPFVGFNRAVLGDVSFGVGTRLEAPGRLRPPRADVPGFRHVFVIMMENQDLGAIAGDTTYAPFENSLIAEGTLLRDFFAEEHPSDGNYLALAGGSTFGVPLTDPLEYDPSYTIRARNIGDLVDAAHETWRGYLQSADGPCDDTLHGWYRNDDLPFLYFADVRSRPSYCAHHLVPLPQLSTDLAKAATTPSFSWVAADGCDDMEGCGIRAGDDFLRLVCDAIFASPAWRTQASLLVITFDEDGYDYERPSQLVPTILVGSHVRAGYVSHQRYTHYSLLRTIEAALGLGSLGTNDRYAASINDAFAAG